MSGTRQVVDRWVKSLIEHDIDREFELSRPDVVHEYPQSGERVRGRENVRAIAENYPAGLPTMISGRVVGSEDRWVTTPSFTLLRIEGSGDVYTVIGEIVYPDGTVWQNVGVLELRDGAISKVTWIFGAPFDAPHWRARWVEKIEQTPSSPTSR